jgi:Peptidase family M28
LDVAVGDEPLALEISSDLQLTVDDQGSVQVQVQVNVNRMMRWLILAALCASCGSFDDAWSLTVEDEMLHITALVDIGPRPADSKGSRAAAAYIRTALGHIPIEETPVGAVELPSIEILGQLIRPARHVQIDDPNLVVRFGPTGKALLVMAHYDTVPDSPGAVDDAASVALLIELARYLHAYPPQQPVMIAFTADEEGGLVGAEALEARHGDEISLAIALDLVGGSGELTLNGASKLIGMSEMTWLARAADRAHVVISAPAPHRVLSRWWPQAERADHGVFTRHGVRAFHLYNRGQDGELIDRAYHTRDDVLGRVDEHQLFEVKRLLRELVDVAPPNSRGDGYWLPSHHNVVVPRWCLIAVEILFTLVGMFGLGALALSGRAAHRSRGAGLLLGTLCFALAITSVTVHRIDSSLASVLVALGVLGLTSRLVARKLPWIGSNRYLGAALVPTLALGIALLALDAAELAWIWLLPAAILAIAPRLPRIIAPLATMLPVVLVLDPRLLREAMFNGFLSPGAPLVILIAVICSPTIAATTWWWRSRPLRGPLGTLVIPVGCGVSLVVGLLVEFAR